MNSDDFRRNQFGDLFLKDLPLIDVRAPIEFKQGHLPGAINLPILNDDERALIGTTYKQHGQEAAVSLGYRLISGPIKEQRVTAWRQFIHENPRTAIYCFRGGKRSQISQAWLRDVGVAVPLVQGGYKAVRQFLIDRTEMLSSQCNLLVVSGPTGSGKTQLLGRLKSRFAVVDLESLAKHRGSAFGAVEGSQPGQILFENSLAVRLLKLQESMSIGQRILVEDESRMIGKCCIPEVFFNQMRDSAVIWIDEPLENRVENILREYVLGTAIGGVIEGRGTMDQALAVFAKYQAAVFAISRKLGGLRAREIMEDLKSSEIEFLKSQKLDSNRSWIEKLLVYYYDPMYLGSLDRRKVKVIFRGSFNEALKGEWSE